MGTHRRYPAAGLCKTRWRFSGKREELEGYNIDNEIIKYIATNVKSNIRELEAYPHKNHRQQIK